MHSHRLELDLHRLDLRFAASRLVEPTAVDRIAQSIERCGQIVPCIVVAAAEASGADAEHLVLIDGYRRVAALRRLGRDTARVEQWNCGLAEAVLGVLARAQDRPFAGIEEALLLRELMQGQGLSQHELARRCGRDVSWVSRRLQLLAGLPEAALAAVRTGKLSAWAATRVVVPLARANTAHADALLAALAATPLTTRELQRWFDRYQQAARAAARQEACPTGQLTCRATARGARAIGQPSPPVPRRPAGRRRAAHRCAPARRSRRRMPGRSALPGGGAGTPAPAGRQPAPPAAGAAGRAATPAGGDGGPDTDDRTGGDA